MDDSVAGNLISFFQNFPIKFYNPETSGIAALIGAITLLLCSAFVSASEIAFFSLTPKDISEIDDELHSSDKVIKNLRNSSERLLATILITNNIVNVSIVMLLNFYFAQVIDFFDNKWLEFGFLTILLTFLLLLFGEIMPKIYSNQHSLSFSRFAAPILSFLNALFYPLSSLLLRSKVFTEHIVSHEVEALTVDDLEKAMELTDKGEIEQESKMLEGIIRFGGEMCREVMTPRVDVLAIDIKTPFRDVLKIIVDNNYSRMPVYQGTQDNIKGVLYVKDLLPHIGKPANFHWQTLLRSAFFVPETKMIDDLLRDFQEHKVHMAIVVDEFGGTSGIVTMEDIIEEIVGEIIDETDEEEKNYQRLNHNTWIFEAKTLLSDFFKIMSIDDDFFEKIEGEADTLAGLLLEIKGEFPEEHERITYRNITFEVMEMDRRRIVKIKVIVR